MEKISRFFVEERDPLFKKGIEKGLEKGIEKGLALGELKGITETTLEIAVNLILESDLDDAFVGRITGLETEKVEKIRALIRENPDNFWEKLKGIKILPE